MCQSSALNSVGTATKPRYCGVQSRMLNAAHEAAARKKGRKPKENKAGPARRLCKAAGIDMIMSHAGFDGCIDDLVPFPAFRIESAVRHFVDLSPICPSAKNAGRARLSCI